MMRCREVWQEKLGDVTAMDSTEQMIHMMLLSLLVTYINSIIIKIGIYAHLRERKKKKKKNLLVSNGGSLLSNNSMDVPEDDSDYSSWRGIILTNPLGVQ